MDALTIAAASGLRSRLEALDMLANNLANASTVGYKTDREFYSLYLSPEASQAPASGSPLRPATLPVIEKAWVDLAQGTLEVTGSPLNLAISGPGFFAVAGPSGPLYTRNGDFRVSASNRLVTSEGHEVRTMEGNRLELQRETPIEVAADGTVTQAGQTLGRIAIVQFPQPAALAKVGQNYYSPTAESGPASATNRAEVQQGRLEASNVNPAETAIRLVTLMRQAEMLQKAISMSGEMNRKAVEEVARVG